MLRGQRALVIGLAREGADLSRFLSQHGASVVVTDKKPAAELEAPMREVGSQGITYRLGGHVVGDLEHIDVVYASPGVPPENELLQAAAQRGIRMSSLVELFFALCPAPILGVTGSAGKSTTTSLIGEMFVA